METAVQKLADWLLVKLGALPPGITALYVEHGESVAADQTLTVYADSFGFESLAGGAFDPSNRDHIDELGDFVWQAVKPEHFVAADFPNLDWTAALEKAARVREVQRVLLGRGIQILVGEHDGDVRVVR